MLGNLGRGSSPHSQNTTPQALLLHHRLEQVPQEIALGNRLQPGDQNPRWQHNSCSLKKPVISWKTVIYPGSQSHNSLRPLNTVFISQMKEEPELGPSSGPEDSGITIRDD